MLVKINLIGKLGELFGSEWELAISNPAEAIRAIASQVEGFTQYLDSSHQQGIVYRLWVDEVEIDEERLLYPIQEELSIAPMIVGAGATGRIITGAALLGLSFATAGITSTLAGQFGLSMVAGGIVELLSPQKNENESSYLSDGSQITRATQGQPVPVLFGTRFVSPIPISVWVDNENIPVDFVP